jgi:hypothetical protein
MKTDKETVEKPERAMQQKHSKRENMTKTICLSDGQIAI